MTARNAIYLLAGGNRRREEAVLINGVEDRRLDTVDREWQAFLQPIIEAKSTYRRALGQTWEGFVDTAYKQAASRGVSLDDLPENPHWIWRNKDQESDSRSFGVECGGSIQGLMFVRLDKQARLSSKPGRPLVYIDYLGTAPWNNINLVAEPSFRGAGMLLMRTAVQLSLDLGRDGVVGLHSLPGAEDFYENGRKCGLVKLGEDSLYGYLNYFEMHPNRVQEFLSRGGRR